MPPRFSIVPARIVDDRRLDSRAVVILVLLGTYIDNNGWCFPSQTTMAERMGVSRQAVARQIDRLVECGYLEKRSRMRSNGSNTSCLYRVIFEDREHDDAEVPDEDELTVTSDPGIVIKGPFDVGGGKDALLDMAKALAEVCGMNFQLNRGRLFKEAKALQSAGIVPDTIYRVYGSGGAWWVSDFRGKKGDLPNPGLIRQTIDALSSIGTAITGDVKGEWFNG